MAATQRDTLPMFTALRLLRPAWPGSLLVGAGLDDAGRALALASLAAGAASIFLEDDTARIREAQREGCCTFTVHSLDEALRIVKNEVRQRHAITVALSGDAGLWLQEMVERGVQPQAFAASRLPREGEAASLTVLCERGMQTLHGFGLCSTRNDGIDLEDVLTRATRGTWRLQAQGASSLAERRANDAALFEATTQDDEVAMLARQWLQAAPSLFPRALERAYWSKV